MKKTIIALLVGMIYFIIITQFIIPLLGCGSTIGEALSLLGAVALGMIYYVIIKKLYNI
jgi:uncharacterized membrane protein